LSTTVEYEYLAASALREAGGRMDLLLATSGGADSASLWPGRAAAAHPFFFSGFVEHPAVVAQSLLVVARVARTRFYTPPGMLAAILRAADPVVTSTPEGLRFESFSACCGVYARLDVLAEGLDSQFWAAGVTNVDVNPPLRQALAALRPSEPLRLQVGDDELRVGTLDGEVVEDKVDLPGRWLKGFAETQLLSAAMEPRRELDAASARRFVQGLPRNSATKSVMWATGAVRSLRLASGPSKGAVCVAGPERLRVVEPLLRYATGLSAFSGEADAASLPMASGWVLGLPGARLTVALSPEKSRGFSGEGGVLPGLAGGTVADDADLVSAVLAFEPRIAVDALAAETGLPARRVLDALDVLAAAGQVGYDLAAGAYFHRPLPLNPEALAAMHPRLAGARELVGAGAVVAGANGGFKVRSGAVDYLVQLSDDGQPDRCTCPWWGKHRGTRGPCKHVLAARIAAQEDAW
jgi:hypothetical protein